MYGSVDVGYYAVSALFHCNNVLFVLNITQERDHRT